VISLTKFAFFSVTTTNDYVGDLCFLIRGATTITSSLGATIITSNLGATTITSSLGATIIKSSLGATNAST
jgi:hypothetical protein